jgi:hypothetical protein
VHTSAQPSEKDADAERLFREGQKLMEERRFGEACPKFDQAYRKDQQLGTLLNLAYCHKEQGAIWQAWLEFKEADMKAVELKRNDRREFARQRMAELEKSLVRVVVERATKAELVEVLVEDHRIPDAEKGVPFAAEPGQRKLTFRAKGKKQVVQLVTIVKGDRLQHVTVPPMEDQEKELPVVEPPPPHPPHLPEEPKPAAAASASPPREQHPERGSGQRTLGILLSGFGLVGVGVGTATGLMTLSNDCTAGAKRENPSGCPDTPAGRDKTAQGEMTGMISNISFGVGGAALIAGIVLYLTAPSGPSSASAKAKHERSAPRLMPEIGMGWASVRGAF